MNNLKAVAYARFSSTKQREESIIHQLEKIREYCSKNGFEIVEEYIDEAQSATTDRRIRFQEMISDAEYADWRFIIVYKLDRLSRNVSDAFHYKKQLSKMGKQIISVIEDFDGNTPEGGFFNLISMGMSEFYVNNMRREVIAGLMQNARSARSTGGIPPLGYDLGKDKKFIINEREAEAVKIIFNKVSRGDSYIEIARFLNSQGYRTKKGNEFGKVFTDILVNRKYIGEFVYNRTTVKTAEGKRNNHQSKPESEIVRIPDGLPRIIDDRLFYRIQAILAERKKFRFYQKPDGRYLLTGLLRCELCGKAICGNITYSGRYKNIRITYKCPTKKPERCHLKELNMINLDKAVSKKLESEILSKNRLNEVCEITKRECLKFMEQSKKRLEIIKNEIEETRVEIQAIEAANSDRKKSLARVSFDLITSKDVLISKLLQEQIAIQQDLEIVEKPTKETIKTALREIRRLYYGGSPNHRKSAIRKIISRITVSNEGVRLYINIKPLINAEGTILGKIEQEIFIPRERIVYPNRFLLQ